MTWADFYLFCFGFGFFFSLVSVLSGHFHLGGGHDGGGHGHFDAHGHADGHVHGHGHTDGGHGHVDDARVRLSPFNMGTLSAFLAWFGGTGYLATKFYHLWVVTTLLMSIAAGVAGASVVFLFLSRVLMREREDLDPADYDMVGVLGRVSGVIRDGGTGEILFSQAGVRRASPARSEDPITIPNGTEVVVTRYENGIAYVRRWEDLAG